VMLAVGGALQAVRGRCAQGHTWQGMRRVQLAAVVRGLWLALPLGPWLAPLCGACVPAFQPAHLSLPPTPLHLELPCKPMQASPGFSLFTTTEGGAAYMARDLLDISSHIFKPEVGRGCLACTLGVTHYLFLACGGVQVWHDVCCCCV